MPIVIDANTPRKEITIKNELFIVPTPYAEGHVLTANEANALNQTYHENLRNNFASAVTAALQDAKAGTAPFNRDALQAALDEYIAEYEFGSRRQGSVAVDPVTKIALRIARDLVKKALIKQEKSVKDYSAEQIAALAEGVLAKHPHIRESAQQEYDIKKAAAATVLDDIVG